MKTVYTATVQFPFHAMCLTRTLQFETKEERENFLERLPDGARQRSIGIEHLMTADDALAELERERAE